MSDIMEAKQTISDILKKADVRVNGKRAWDIQVHDDRTFARVLQQGSLGAGESYMDGWWSSRDLLGTILRIDESKVVEQITGDWRMLARLAGASLINQQSRRRAWQVGQQHYDLGNDLYELMLDKRMTYSCGYWAKAKNLDAAQEAKLDMICKKLGIKKGQHILDIGCGWGSWMFYAAEKYKVRVTGVTVSKEQAAMVNAEAKRRKLPVVAKVQDYRDLTGQFDHLVSVGMFEHVGPKNYKTYLKTAKNLLKPGGLFLLHTIGGNYSQAQPDPWIHKYIFPNGVLPSPKQVTTAMEATGWALEDWHNFGPDYARTLAAWRANFLKGYPKLDHVKYDERFKRMWIFYLTVCEAGFAARRMQLWQIVLSPEATAPKQYRSLR